MPKPELRNGIQMDDECQATEEMLSNGKTPTESHQSEDEDKNQGLPIDRGWAWVVLGGTFELESNTIGELVFRNLFWQLCATAHFVGRNHKSLL